MSTDQIRMLMTNTLSRLFRSILNRNLSLVMIWLNGLSEERVNGYVIVTWCSSKSKGQSSTVNRVWLECDRASEHKSSATNIRVGSKKIGCLFQLLAKYDAACDAWRVHVKNDQHNHEPAQYLKGHAFARRLSPNEYLLVEKLYAQNTEPHNILVIIRQNNPQSVCVMKDIYNVISKIKSHKKVGDTLM